MYARNWNRTESAPIRTLEFHATDCRLPGDWGLVVGGEVGVGLGEGLGAEEAAVGGKRRGVGRFDHAMACGVDEGAFLLRIGAPEDEDEVLASGGEGVDDGIGEGLPALALVGAGLVGLDGEGRVEQQDALIRPSEEVGHVAEFLGDVLE